MSKRPDPEMAQFRQAEAISSGPTTFYVDPAEDTPETRFSQLEAIRAGLQALTDQLGVLAAETRDAELCKWHKALKRVLKQGAPDMFEGVAT